MILTGALRPGSVCGRRRRDPYFCLLVSAAANKKKREENDRAYSRRGEKTVYLREVVLASM